MCHHAGFRLGASGEVGTLSQLGSAWRRRRVMERGSYIVRFVLCLLLICIVVVTVPFVCCFVKLPLSRPTSFCLFLSILLLTLVGGGAAAWCFCCWPQPNHKKHDILLKDIFSCISSKIDFSLFSLVHRFSCPRL